MSRIQGVLRLVPTRVVLSCLLVFLVTATSGHSDAQITNHPPPQGPPNPICASGCIELTPPPLCTPPNPPPNTRSIASGGHMAIVNDITGGTRLYAVESGCGGVVASRPTSGAATWSEGVPNPSVSGLVQASWYTDTGVAGASFSMPTGLSRIYAVSQPVPSLGPGIPAVPAQLWELTTTAASWRLVGDPTMTGASITSRLDSSPSIAAIVSGSNLWIAIRTSDQHLLTATYPATRPLNPATVSWVDWSPTCRVGVRGGHCSMSDVTMVIGRNNLPEIYTVSPAGVLQRLRPTPFGPAWNDIPAPGPGLLVTAGGIAASRWRFGAGQAAGELRIAVGVHTANGLSDRLFLARSIDDGASWGWTHLTAPGGDPASGYATPFRNSIDQAFRFANPSVGAGSGIRTAVYVDDFAGDVLVPCVPQRLPNPVPGTIAEASCITGLGIGAVMPHPADLMPGRDLIGASVVGELAAPNPTGLQPALFRAFTSGSLASTGYVYEYESSADGLDRPIWSNVLAPTTPFVFPGSVTTADPPTGPVLGGEYTSDEFFGTVTISDNNGTLNVSVDDGNTWTLATNGPTGGDVSGTFDSAGNYWAAALNGGVAIARLPAPIGPSPVFNPFITLPGSATATPSGTDREYIAAANGVLFITWRDFFGIGPGQMSVCRNDAAFSCDTALTAWCPPVALPASCANGQACIVTASGPPNDRRVWIAMGGPNASLCPARAGFGSIAVVEITNVSALGTPVGMPPTCTAPTYSTPDCIYYTTQPLGVAPLFQPLTQEPLGYAFPGSFGGWQVRFEGARDSHDLALEVQDWVQVADGQPCGNRSVGPCSVPSQCDASHVCASGQCVPVCRPEVRLLRREASTGTWLGPNGGASVRSPLILPASFPTGASANADQSLPLQAVSHAYPVITFFDDGQLDAYWFDFRVPSPTPSSWVQEFNYVYARRHARYSQTTMLVSQETQWTTVPPGIQFPLAYPGGGPLVLDSVGNCVSGCDGLIGDIDIVRTAHLHTHTPHMLFNVPASGATNPRYTLKETMALVWSPRSPPP